MTLKVTQGDRNCLWTHPSCMQYSSVSIST